MIIRICFIIAVSLIILNLFDMIDFGAMWESLWINTSGFSLSKLTKGVEEFCKSLLDMLPRP